ncbi:MAG: ATP-binding cassette subfamily C protein [Rickettsiales bacterium]|jgi:ATP-binding cassette subfamily C protein
MKDKNDNLLKEYLGLCKRAFAYNFIFSFFINILMLATSIYSLQVLDRVLSSNSMETLLMLSLIMIVVYVILAFLQIIRSFIFTQVSNWLDSKLSSPLLESSITFEAKTKGSQNLRDLQSIKSFITGQAVTHLFDAPWAIVYFIVIFFIHWINGFVVLSGAAILLILALLNEKLTKKWIEKSNEINVLSMRKVDVISRNAEVVKAMGMKGDLTNSWQKINGELTKITTSLGVRSAIITNITKSIRLLIQMSVMAVGAILVMKGKMSAGGIIATSILTGKALAPFDQAVTIYKSLLNTKKSYSRLAESLKTFEEKEEKIQLPQPQGQIDLDKIFYKIPQTDQMIIKGVNISIKPGEIIGIIGPSGSGKTTLARLIANVLTPDKGSVRLDGSDLKNQDSEEIGKYVGYLPQDVELFEGTIKDNIARMKEKAESEEIIEAAKFAGIHDLVLKLAKSYESNAINLSAGQRQRIGLSRAFFGKPKFVILDEPNSNLDSAGDIALMNTISNAKKAEITTIVISHRPTILNIVDKILVLHDGEAKMFDEANKVIEQLSGKSQITT